MSPQSKPSYPSQIGKIEPEVLKILELNYGLKNISNLICFFHKDLADPIAYIIEENELNLGYKNLPQSRNGISFLEVCLSSSPKKINPILKNIPLDKIKKYNSWSGFILSDDNTEFVSVDLDYIFKTKRGWKGFEFTTFYMPFKSKEVSERLISKMNRRPSWKGPGGAQALRKILNSSQDLKLDLFLVAANTIGRVGSEIDVDGNCYVFELSHQQIDNLESGKPPANGIFGKFKDFNKIIEDFK